jgi:hypothetical protein
MAKEKLYTKPITLRLTPTMIEYAKWQAEAKGISLLDWIRFAIAFTYWEEDFVRNTERRLKGWKPGDKPLAFDQHDFDYLREFQFMAREYEDRKLQDSQKGGQAEACSKPK